MSAMNIRIAQMSDIPAIEELMNRSVMIGMAKVYTEEQRKQSLGHLFGVDRKIIRDQTYLVGEVDGKIIASGGWSFRKTLYGSDTVNGRNDDWSTPGKDAANLRAFFIDPAHSGTGMGSRLYQECERPVRDAGYTRFQVGATLSGLPFYVRLGFKEVEHQNYILPSGLEVPIVMMERQMD